MNFPMVCVRILMADLPPITLRRYHPVPLLSVARRAAIDDAVAGLDFANEQAVHAARRRITHMGRLERLYDWAFHCRDKALCLDALATLYLYKRAEETGGNLDSIQASRSLARKTLATRLSPAGRDALRQSCDPGRQDNDFAQFIAIQDRYGMIGDTFMQEGHEDEFFGYYDWFGNLGVPTAQILAFTATTDPLSSQAYWTAIAAYRKAGLRVQANAACMAAAVDATKAATAYGEAQLHERAGDAWLRAAEAYMEWGKLENESARTAENEFAKAADAFTKARDAYTLAGRQRRAERAALEAEVASHLALGRHGLAAHAGVRAAELYEQHLKFERAARTYFSAAENHKTAGADRFAAEAATEAANLFMRLNMHAEAGEAWELAAHAHVAEESREPAEAAREEANQSYIRAGQPERVRGPFWPPWLSEEERQKQRQRLGLWPV